MRKLSSYLISVFLIALFSTSIHAGQEALCDPQKAPGVTKGLYGLCIAYLASGSTSQALVDKYNLKKSPSDPVMPGTADKRPTLSCPCWNTLTADDIGADPAIPPSGCSLSEEADFIAYESLDNPENILSEQLFVTTGFCFYSNSVTGALNQQPLDSGQEDVCRLAVLDLAIRDFQGFTCLP